MVLYYIISFYHIYIYICKYIYIYLQAKFILFNNFGKSTKTYSQLCSYINIQKITLNLIETLKIPFSNTKHKQHTKIHFKIRPFESQCFQKVGHSCESAFSAHFYGPPLAGLIQYVYIYIYMSFFMFTVILCKI